MSAIDLVYLDNDDDYLQWGEWVVRFHKEAHFLEMIDSSIEYFPPNASCDLEHDMAY